MQANLDMHKQTIIYLTGFNQSTSVKIFPNRSHLVQDCKPVAISFSKQVVEENLGNQNMIIFLKWNVKNHNLTIFVNAEPSHITLGVNLYSDKACFGVIL